MPGKQAESRHGNNDGMVRPAAGAPANAAGRAMSTQAEPVGTPSAPPAGGSEIPAVDVDDLPRGAVGGVIRSKIQPPPVRRTTLSRQRLLDGLRVASHRRVTLLVAEAGYGKTTLLADFSSRGIVRCLWYKLDSTDRDWVTIVNYLVSAAREVLPEFGTETLRLLSAQDSDERARQLVLRSLLRELEGFSDRPTALILDDFHTVDESADVRDVLSRLLTDAPDQFRFIISSRRPPGLPFARLHAMGELTNFVTDDLRFSKAETERLFADSFGHPLDPDTLGEVDRRTEGWAASLQLLYSSIRGQPANAARALARALSGAKGPIYDFLAEEVLTHLKPDIEQFVMRAALLDRVSLHQVAALFGDSPTPPSSAQASEWIAEAEGLGLLSRGSQSSDARQFHPLLREFLLRQLAERAGEEEIRGIHGRVAETTEAIDPLAACHHYIEAGQADAAMRTLNSSVMLTMGSGRWGAASQLIDRLTPGPAQPALVAIKARRLFEEGNTSGAAALLESIDVATQPAAVRAVVRQTKLSMGWRSGDRRSLATTVREIGQDAETPELIREIAEIFIDSDPQTSSPTSLPELAQRLEQMAAKQQAAGHTFYAAISLHNAAITYIGAGQFHRARQAGELALAAFGRLGPSALAQYSTHAVLATCAFELGQAEEGFEEIRLATESGRADGDVHAECAFTLATIGDRDRALALLVDAERLQQQGRWDLSGALFAGYVQVLLRLPSDPSGAVRALEAAPSDVPLDLGLNLQHAVFASLARLMNGAALDALALAKRGRAIARQRRGLAAEVRLALLCAIAESDPVALRWAIEHAASVGELALLELADAIGEALHLLPNPPAPLTRSIERWRSRWLPVLRRQLEKGQDPTAHAAARLLDQYGTIDDVVRLRAFDKTYGKRARTNALGVALARRVSPKLEIRDLGRVSLAVGDRIVQLSQIRRKPASLLMYLITRPNFTATREQVLDELWPETDPTSGYNSLNQSLYFLRREIDPWYEDDVSVDYLSFQAELLWLDSDLTHVHSAAFLLECAVLLSGDFSATRAAALIRRYSAPFSPEFEYEEWAISWRTRVHATFLNLASTTIDRMTDRSEFGTAVDVGQHVLAIDPTAGDIERKLIWLYSRTGAFSAAVAQYRHLVATHEADGLEPPTFDSLTSGHRPR